MTKRRFLGLLMALALAGCGGGGGNASSSGGEDDDMGPMLDEPVVQHGGDPIAELGITPPPTPWAEMSHADREMYMVGKVLPIMNQLFVRQYGNRYPATGIGCETCHGPDGEQRAFAMPSGHLLALPPMGSPQHTQLRSAIPESFRFMAETVGPTMATLLGMPEYRCGGCHTAAP